MLNIISRNLGGLKNIRSTVNKVTTIMESKSYNTLSIKQHSPAIFHVQLNRPEKLNALNDLMWIEIGECFNDLSSEADCRVIVLSGSGKSFCSGIDLMDAMKLFQNIADETDVARKCKVIGKSIKRYQDSFTAIEKCAKPVIAAIHGACIGGAVDMICSTDIRYCTSDAWFQIKEVDLGMAADVGTLQRLPKIIGSDSLIKELAFTGRKMLAPEALQVGFVSHVANNQESLMKKAFDVAEQIASKSPVAVQGIKLSLNYSRDHTIDEGLNHINMRNQAMLQSEDFISAASALATKSELPVFSKL
ncbi:delta(3,5)-Delta(2,4)-dienoyl-CoA isomerase, mitochondrial isoform X1 [Phymastichus coffea]|uniref:delta(3,5)-Delta(2,4)-dienoyl-CoA isomerase, mitochondrial isoform X1 n=1 Tax=Phymastichus coffea TaxID=108790 RepID=UPI00273AD7D9|nr:delta(3,5)-Delta(2,4)-dienoyl-CoA isomerase, mitochondrial isoform X1 [Phymastichus coffea]XP_058806118.1 delta(3,5)-Delta(2,4)-dienoyl-CoA isomerase, mitochondrial isoform X1 [Phymastichus coffea]